MLCQASSPGIQPNKSEMWGVFHLTRALGKKTHEKNLVQRIKFIDGKGMKIPHCVQIMPLTKQTRDVKCVVGKKVQENNLL